MKRIVKRVPLNFDAPLYQAWTPSPQDASQALKACASCNSEGLAPWALEFKNQWYGYSAFDPLSHGGQLHTAQSSEVASTALNNVRAVFSEEDAPTGSPYLAQLVDNEVALMLSRFNTRRDCHLTQVEVDYLWEQGALEDFAEKPTALRFNEKALFGFLGVDLLEHLLNYHAQFHPETGYSIHCPDCAALNASKALGSVPVGPGFQLWLESTTDSDIAPITPVFASEDALNRHCLSALGLSLDFDSRV